MRLEVRLDFGHTRFPSAKELALGEALSLSVFRKARAFIEIAGQGTDHGSVYCQFEFLKRDYKKVMQIVEQILRELSVRHLAKMAEQQPLSSYDEPKTAKRVLSRKRRSPLKNESPPTYLRGKVRPSVRKGPARRLFSGNWCGHGRETFLVFDIATEKENSFRVRLPQSDDEELNPPLVLAVSEKGTFSLYDSREHVASVYSDKEYRTLEPRLKRYFHCPRCNSQDFQFAVGFEIANDREGPNDTSWFALAAQCIKCNWMDLIYDDETQ
jgi:hypothetical protein